ncbi:hypothetical protein [Micromonospora sp. NPDC051006]|uniref:hypothetical protein n=1 Tax=Micromonospora sp. NPDC051006 TaxID=3364283 RepID=UPI00379B30A7
MHHTPTPALVARTVRDLFADTTAQMCAYWLPVDGSRDEYGQALAEELGDAPIVPLIIRAERFDNPNAIMVELVHILERNKQRCLDALGHGRGDTRFALVLLARTDLGVSQSSSPVVLPDWFPHLGGQSIHCYVYDLSWRVEVPVDSAELGLPDLHRRLFALECALVRRLVDVHESTPQAQRGLFDVIGRPRDPGWAWVLSEADAELGSVVNVAGYRPTVRHSKSISARLWEVSRKARGQEMQACAGALATALGITDDSQLRPWRQGLLGLLNGTAAVDGRAPLQFALHTVTTIAATCEYFIWEAHPERYQYPVTLLRLLIDEMNRSLGDAESTINGLRETWEPVGGDIPEQRRVEEAVRGGQ